MTQVIDFEGLVSTRQAAWLMDTSPEYVRVLWRQGKLDAIKVGDRLWIKVPPERIKVNKKPVA